MTVHGLQIAATLLLSVMGGVTVGQYPAKRRALRRFAFGEWRERQFVRLLMLAGFSSFLPDLVSRASALVETIR